MKVAKEKKKRRDEEVTHTWSFFEGNFWSLRSLVRISAQLWIVSVLFFSFGHFWLGTKNGAIWWRCALLFVSYFCYGPRYMMHCLHNPWKEVGMGKGSRLWVFNSSRRWWMGRRSWVAILKAICSLLVVLNAISDCSLLTLWTGQPPKVIM